MSAEDARFRLIGQRLLLVTVVTLVVWLPRGLALDRFVTVDETSWLTFSGNFYHALARGDFRRTFQIAHPGVTTTWAGTAAFLLRYPGYADEARGQVRWVTHDVGSIIRAEGHDPVELLAAGRAVVVLGITAVLAMAAVAAMDLFGFWGALVGFLLIASDPFHIALSRLLHVDGMVSSLMLLSVLALLSYLYGSHRRRDLVISAVAAGLAWLTKVPALVLIPFAVGLVLFTVWPTWHRGQWLSWAAFRRAARLLVVWGAVSALVFVLAWPAMWVGPINSVRAIVHEALGMARHGHVEAPQFFNGEIVRAGAELGWHFYPITYLWRTTPVTLLGLGLAAVAFARSRAKTIESSHRRPATALVLYVALFTIMMTLGAKKFDRYLLPIYAPLDLIAGLGWVAAARWLRQSSHELLSAGAPALTGLAVVGQAAMAAAAFPYYLSHYNPLLGGPVRAPRVMMIGWGEGLDQTARYLNAKPDAEQLRVVTPFWNGTFSYFFKGRIVDMPAPPWGTSGNSLSLAADYCVIYINQRQRGRLPRELVEYVDALKPEMVVRIQGLEYAYVYDLRDTGPPPSTGEPARSTER